MVKIVEKSSIFKKFSDSIWLLNNVVHFNVNIYIIFKNTKDVSKIVSLSGDSLQEFGEVLLGVHNNRNKISSYYCRE